MAETGPRQLAEYVARRWLRESDDL